MYGASGSESEGKLFDEQEANKNYEWLKDVNIEKSYLKFLQRLTESQQRHEIQQWLFLESSGSIPKQLLTHPTVVALNKSLDSTYWKFEPGHYRIGATEIDSPRFSERLCIIPVLFRYENLNPSGWPVNLEHKLFVKALVYIDDEGRPMVGTVTCWSNQAEVDAQKAEFAHLQKAEFLNYLRTLTPVNHRSAIFELARLTWGTDNPSFLGHPQLSAAITQLGIHDLGYGHHEVGLVELETNYCAAPITYQLYGYLADSDPEYFGSVEAYEQYRRIEEFEAPEAKYYIQVHILACITPSSTGDIGAELSIENMCFSIVPEKDEPTNVIIVS
jgi:hypothetical protein